MTRGILSVAVAALLAAVGCGGVGKSQGQLRSALDAKQATLDGCYEKALVRDKTTAGDMTVWVHVAEKGGAVTKVDVEESNVEDAELAQCVERTLVGTVVEPSPKASLKVEYTIEFTPQT